MVRPEAHVASLRSWVDWATGEVWREQERLTLSHCGQSNMGCTKYVVDDYLRGSTEVEDGGVASQTR